MSFSAEWLALREPADHAARSQSVAEDVRGHFRNADSISVVDLGCGTGSNLRGTVALLPDRQEWLLVDYDPALLTAARTALSDWADGAAVEGDALTLRKDGRRLRVRFRQFDLSGGVGSLLGEQPPDLVTASALFDLISKSWIEAFVQDIAVTGAAFYTVLSYDGRDAFLPADPLDAAVIAAFGSHQGSNKGFGPAAGPMAAETLGCAFRAAGYSISEGDSPWRVGSSHAEMARQLLTGIAGAVRETGELPGAEIDQWLAHRLKAVNAPDGAILIGHTDTFARKG